MNIILATIGENQFSAEQINALQHVLINTFSAHISPVKPTVLWNKVSVGNAFNNYQQKHPTIITFGCPNTCLQENRNAFFDACCNQWINITNQHKNDVVIGALDQPTFKAFVKRNSAQLTLLGKLKFYKHVIASLIGNKIKHGFLAFNSSLK